MPSKKKPSSKPKESKEGSAKPNPELPRKIQSRKAEQKKHELTESLAHPTVPSPDSTPSDKLARTVKTRKAETKKHELTEALAHPGSSTGASPSHASEHPGMDYFQDLGSRIARRAYELHERRGRVHGHDLEDWLEAERQILSGESS